MVPEADADPRIALIERSIAPHSLVISAAATGSLRLHVLLTLVVLAPLTAIAIAWYAAHRRADLRTRAA